MSDTFKKMFNDLEEQTGLSLNSQPERSSKSNPFVKIEESINRLEPCGYFAKRDDPSDDEKGTSGDNAMSDDDPEDTQGKYMFFF
ncbi:hypothetical protein ACLMJK_000131 [Lecanora helva]